VKSDRPNTAKQSVTPSSMFIEDDLVNG
jgi:hypothetical protein